MSLNPVTNESIAAEIASMAARVMAAPELIPLEGTVCPQLRHDAIRPHLEMLDAVVRGNLVAPEGEGPVLSRAQLHRSMVIANIRASVREIVEGAWAAELRDRVIAGSFIFPVPEGELLSRSRYAKNRIIDVPSASELFKEFGAETALERMWCYRRSLIYTCTHLTNSYGANRIDDPEVRRACNFIETQGRSMIQVLNAGWTSAVWLGLDTYFHLATGMPAEQWGRCDKEALAAKHLDGVLPILGWSLNGFSAILNDFWKPATDPRITNLHRSFFAGTETPQFLSHEFTAVRPDPRDGKPVFDFDIAPAMKRDPKWLLNFAVQARQWKGGCPASKVATELLPIALRHCNEAVFS